MKFPFFKPSKPEPSKQFIPTPARSQVVLANPSANFRIQTKPAKPAMGIPTLAAPASATATAKTAPTTNLTVPLRLGAIMNQLPRGLFTITDKAQLALVKVHIPQNLVIPQLANGRVTLTVAQFTALLPAHIRNDSVAAAAQQQQIILPLSELIAALPPEALNVAHERTISLEDPEMDNLPQLVDESLMTPTPVLAPVSEDKNSSPSDTQLIQSVTAEPLFTEKTAPATPRPDVMEFVNVSLRNLIAGMPDNVLACARADLWRKADFDVPVKLPLQPLLAQLQTARIALPLADILQHLPAAILADPLPEIDDVIVTVPLSEIVAQLPPHLFTSQLSAELTAEFAAVETEIPTPFTERNPRPVATTPEVPQAKAEPAPAPQPEPVAPAAVELDSSALDNDSFQLFTEKKTAPAPVEAPAESVAAVEPVVEAPVEPPVAVEPVALAVKPTPEPVVVVEPVAEILAEPVVAIEPAVEAPVETPAAIEPVALTVEPTPEPVAEVVPVIETPAAPVAAVEPVVELAVETPVAIEPVALAVEPTPEPVVVVEPVAEIPAEPVAAIEPAVEAPVETPAAIEPVALAVEPTPEPVAEVGPVIETPAAPVAAVEPVVETPVAVEATPEPVAEVSPEPVAAVVPIVETPATPVVAETTTDEDIEDAIEEPVSESTSFDETKFLIDLNRCTVEDLRSIPGVGPALAKRIIDHRASHGEFTGVEELRLIPGIGRKTFRALAGVEPRSLNRLLGIDDGRQLTLQEIVKLAGQLRGVEGCMLAMADGLFLAGAVPPHLDQEAISVFAPQIFKKVGRYTKELKVGQVRRFTIFTDTQPLSVFGAGDVFLIIVHDQHHFSKKLLRQCERISQEIARLCRQRTVV